MPRSTRKLCNTCRQRKLKCDEVHPICHRCAKAQRYCDRSERQLKSYSMRSIYAEKSSPLNDHPREALESPTLATYFRHYIDHVAPWYDLSDEHCHFRTVIPRIALDEPLMFHAIIALSAMVMSHTIDPPARLIAETYHASCIRRLIDLGPEDVLVMKDVALATTCLLRSYEILAETRDPNRHLQGAFSRASQILDVFNDPSEGIFYSGFWNYLRQDITLSLLEKCPLKIDLNGIIPLDGFKSDQAHLDAITLILGQAVNAMIGSTAQKVHERWCILSSSLQRWVAGSPRHFQPVSRSILPLTRLPIVHMRKTCHVASRYYCLVSFAALATRGTPSQVGLLMTIAVYGGLVVNIMKTKEDIIRTKEDLLEQIGLEICGVAFTSNDPSVLVNAFGPISYCARYIRDEASQQEVLRRLMASKKVTGWPVEKIAAELQGYWTRVALFRNE
ncbi:hypothetical protein F4777DRAFT_590108 [Nemania sp. FL0916]|nr:hypothetical protein F4777DRAFT_590108 [Nemania sp. FL0916]